MLDVRMPGGARQALVLFGAVFVAAVLNAGAAAADGPTELRSRIGDACLDAPSAGWLTPVVVNPCNGGDTQRWNVTPDGRLESAAFPGQCLNVPEDGWAVRLAACWDSRRWTIDPNGHVKAVLGGCLALPSGTGPGALVSVRFCRGAPEQGWDSVP
jgi:Ricin-type beta-trefoil lectin domain